MCLMDEEHTDKQQSCGLFMIYTGQVAIAETEHTNGFIH